MKKIFAFIIGIALVLVLNMAVAQDELPDLVVTSFTAPTSASTQQQVELAWTVKNQGNAQAQTSQSSGWIDRVYFSTDSQIDGNDQQLAAAWHTQPLLPDENYTATTILTIPNVPTGTYYLILEVDQYKYVNESDEANNISSVKPVTISVPDLVATSLNTPASANTQEWTEVSWTVVNQGNGTAIGSSGYYGGYGNVWYDNLYLSTDNTLDDSDKLLANIGYLNKPLAAGESYTQTQQVIIPNVSTGNYYLLVKTDPSNYVYETNEDNNTLTQPITINVPDLTVSSLNAPASASTQQQVEISWTVKNQGSGTAIGSSGYYGGYGNVWYDNLYLSTDNVLDSSDKLLANIGYLNKPLAAGESYTTPYTIKIPEVPAGDYYLLLQADSQGNNIYESNEDNNISVKPITIRVPDLKVTSIQAPITASPQQQVEISWTVKNQGNGDAVTTYLWTGSGYGWYLGHDIVYLSTDEQLDDNDQQIANLWHTQPLASGQSYTETTPVTISNLTAGTYYLILKTDESNAIYESDEANNISSVKPITIIVPDLIPTSISAPVSVSTQQQVEISWTVKNQGGGPTPLITTNGWLDKFYLSTDEQLDSSDQQLASGVHLQPLPAGESYTQTTQVTIPNLIAGTYYLLAKTDEGSAIYESDEANNISSAKPINITVPDLAPISFTAPTSASPQQQIEISWTVRNQGNGQAPLSSNNGWLDKAYISTDEQLDSSDQRLAFRWHTQPLPAGQSYTETTPVTIPNLTAGNYYLLAKADEGDYIYESSEWNNVYSRLITIGEKEVLSETTSSELTLTEDLLSQKAVSSNLAVTGDLTGAFNFTDFEITKVNSGSFLGRGFTKGQWNATLEGVFYQGSWQGVLFPAAKERKIYLKGIISGSDAGGIIDGYLTESIPESGIYDQYHAVWKLDQLADKTVFVTLNLAGSLNYLQTTNYPATKLNVLQIAVSGKTTGHYNEPIDTVLTHLRVTDTANPYNGQGCSIISYVTKTGSGEGWTFDELTAAGKISLLGQFSSPLLGIVSGSLDSVASGRTLSLSIERIDLALPPMADLEIKTWGPERISPGQTVNYLIEYRNNGVKSTDNTTIIFALDPSLEYISSTYSYHNYENNEVRMDLGTVAAKTEGLIRVTVKVPWGLVEGIGLENIVRVATSTKEEDLSAINTTKWRQDIQVGDIVLVHDDNSKLSLVAPGSYWTHAGGVVYGTYADHWETKRTGVERKYEGYFVIEAIPKEGVIVSDIRNLDYPLKENVKLVRVESLTEQQRNEITTFWNAQINKPYQELSEYLDKDSDPQSSKWYCSELIWGAYFKLGINFDSEAYGSAIAPQEIAMSSLVTTVSEYDFRYLRWKVAVDIINRWISTITTAHDPNELSVAPSGDVKPGDTLTYTIHYENEGKGIAYGVYFTDTLEEDLDDSNLTIGPIFDSATGEQIGEPGTYNPATRTISWFVGEVTSKQGGSATFSVKVKNTTPDKSEVINYATVYFPSVPEATRTNGTVNKVTTSVDNAPPITTASISPEANEAGWNKSDVTISLSAIDNETGSGVVKTEYSLDATNWTIYTTPFNIATEGITTVSYKSTDNAGNIEPLKTLKVKLDKTPPIIIATTLPQPNTNGWNNTDVTVTFTATDTLSGVDVGSLTSPQLISSENKDQHIGGQAFDLAGNQASTYVSLNIDKTKPVISLTSPQENKEYFHAQAIPLTYTISDALSQIASTSLTLDGVALTGSTNIQTSIGTHTLIITAMDKAGNQEILNRHFTVKLKAKVTIKPEVFLCNRGIFLAFVEFPQGYNTRTITDATCDGAPAKKIIPVGRDIAIILFRREDITELPLDKTFTVKGHFNKGLLFEGTDTIKKVFNKELTSRIISKNTEDNELDKAVDELFKLQGVYKDCLWIKKHIRDLNK